MPEGVDGSTTSLNEDMSLLNAEDQETSLVPVSGTEENEIIEEQREPEESRDFELVDVDESETPTTDISPYTRHSITDINKVYPEFFRKFPLMKNVIQREKEYTNVFTTIQEAKDSKESSDALQTLQEDIISGDCSKLVSAIKDISETGLNNFSGNILKAIAKASSDAHWKAALPLIQNIVRNCYQEGLRRGDNDSGNNLRMSSEHVALYLLGDHRIASGEVSALKDDRPSPEAESLKKEREEFEQSKYSDFQNSVANHCSIELKKMILEKDKNDNLRIDPNGTMSQWMKDQVTNEIFAEVGKQLSQDKIHIANMDSMWKDVRKGNRSSEISARLSSAFLARARSLVGTIRAQKVSEALGQKMRIANGSPERVSRREPGGSGSIPRTSQRTPNAKQIDWSRTSDLDLLNDNITYRKG